MKNIDKNIKINKVIPYLLLFIYKTTTVSLNWKMKIPYNSTVNQTVSTND